MHANLKDLGFLVRAVREQAGLSQEELAAATEPPTNRTAVALLEQGRRLPTAIALQAICGYCKLPTVAWKPLLEPLVETRLLFEDALTELVGHRVSLREHDPHVTQVAQMTIAALFGTGNTKEQVNDAFGSLLVFYNIPKPSAAFMERYLQPDAFRSIEAFLDTVRVYQKQAIRLFASFSEAYLALSQSTELQEVVAPLQERDTNHLNSYRARTEWSSIEVIPQENLPDLGYISAARVKKEQAERQLVATFLEDPATKVAEGGRQAISSFSEKRRRKISSLLRTFESALEHDLLSPLFVADADELRREAVRIAPKGAADLEKMAATQATGQRNLARYLAADHLDVYVATSMRSDADFVSVNSFVVALFGTDNLRPLKLRYFNPTQSWIEDRVAKGLVEAIMLKRADFTVYMAQKSDTFGKDSEASVALGQGKPVVVYVPRLFIPEAKIDSEALGMLPRGDLQKLIEAEVTGDPPEIDATWDDQALLSQVLELRLNAASDDVLGYATKVHWADFDLYGEASRIEHAEERASYRKWLDGVVDSSKAQALSEAVRRHLVGIMVATATNFERRATVFRAVHPLALQVILSTGVLNGILVARSVDSCATLLEQLVRNALVLDLQADDDNYRLVESTTRSTVRVVSRHQLITNAFGQFYSRE